MLPLNRGVVAYTKNEPPQDPCFDKDHVCIKFSEDVDKTPSKSWNLFGRDLDFGQEKTGRPILAFPNLTFKGEEKDSNTLLWSWMCASSYVVSHRTGFCHRASTQIKVERPLLVEEKTCWPPLFPSNCPDYHKKKGPFLENCTFIKVPLFLISAIWFKDVSEHHYIVPFYKLPLSFLLSLQGNTSLLPFLQKFHVPFLTVKQHTNLDYKGSFLDLAKTFPWKTRKPIPDKTKLQNVLTEF